MLPYGSATEAYRCWEAVDDGGRGCCGRSFAVSHHFGYGLLDVDAMVSLAQNWTSVPEQHRCEIVARLPARCASPSTIRQVIHTIGAFKEVDKGAPVPPVPELDSQQVSREAIWRL